MIISQSELFQKISTTLIRLKNETPVEIETAGTISMLENTLNLLSATAIQLNIEEFPVSEEDCLDLIHKDGNGLNEDDLEELQYLAGSVRWALGKVA